MVKRMLGWVLVAAGAGACGDGVDSKYYSGTDSAALGAAGNEADCSTCHSNDGSQAGFSGTTLKDIAYHASWKGGDAMALRDAANACVTGWMGGAALAADDDRWLGLEAYLQSISDPAMTAAKQLAPEVLANQAAYETAYAGGDAAAGAAKYAGACRRCHGAGLKLGTVAAFPLSALKNVAIGRIAQKVRTSGPPPSGISDTADSTPGPMPFFEPSDLSASDLKDVIAFIKTSSQ